MTDTRCLSVSDLTSLSVMISRSTHVAANGILLHGRVLFYCIVV